MLMWDLIFVSHMFSVLVVLAVWCGFVSMTQGSIPAILHREATLECFPGVPRTSVRWADKVYNSDDNFILIFGSHDNPGEICYTRYRDREYIVIFI